MQTSKNNPRPRAQTFRTACPRIEYFGGIRSRGETRAESSISKKYERDSRQFPLSVIGYCLKSPCRKCGTPCLHNFLNHAVLSVSCISFTLIGYSMVFLCKHWHKDIHYFSINSGSNEKSVYFISEGLSNRCATIQKLRRLDLEIEAPQIKIDAPQF